MASICPVCANEVDPEASVCPFCGYKILGSTQSFKPIQITDNVGETAAASEKTGELRIVRGPQTGIAIELQNKELTLGRDPQCDIFLNDMTVSRNHARIEARPEGFVLTDTNSYNGVWVNDKMIETCLLKPGDVIQIGAFCLVFRQR